MEEHPNAAAYREGFAAFGAGDMAALGDLIAEDVEWYEAGNPEPIRGRDAIFARLGGLTEEIAIEADAHDILATDQHVVALLEVNARRGDDALQYRAVEVMHMEGGEITQRWAFVDDQQAVDDFFS